MYRSTATPLDRGDMSVPYAKSSARAKVCSNTTISRLRTLRHIPVAEAAVAHDTEYATVGPRPAVTYAGTDLQLTSIIYDPTEATNVTESVELEVPENMLGQIDLWLNLRAFWNTPGAGIPAATNFPSAYVASPFLVRVRRVFVATTGATTVDATFNGDAGSLDILVPRTFWDPELLDAAGDLAQNYVSSSVLKIQQEDGTLLPAGRYVIDLLLAQDDQFYSEQFINAANGMIVHDYATPPPGFAYDGIQANAFQVVPSMMTVRPTFLYAAATKSNSSFQPMTTAQLRYLCTDSACTPSTEITATALNTCLATCT